MTDTLGTVHDQVVHGGLPADGRTLSREEVDAALRGATYQDGPDVRGVAIASETAVRLTEEFPDAVLDWSSFRNEVTVVVRVNALVDVATFMRDTAGYGLLSDISPCDWLDRRAKRFSIQYICTKVVAGAPRVRLQVWVDEGEDVPSLVRVYPTADWHEREAYDFFGISFSGREPMRRLLMADDWVGHPLRKDYPLGGEPVKFTNSLREI